MKKLKELFGIQSIHGAEYNMHKYIVAQMGDIEGVVIDSDCFGNIFATKGISDAFVCVSAHIDTVHDITSKFEVVIKRGVIKPANKFTGVGGDDKCGIYAALELLRRCDALKVALFVGEECGCVGSSKCDISFFDNVGCLIGIDRRGKSDIITSFFDMTITNEFLGAVSPLMNTFGYSETNGMTTDVFEIQGRMDNSVCAINISCGYYNPHTLQEYVVIKELMNSIDFAQGMIAVLDGVVWSWSSRSHYGGDDYAWVGGDGETDWCDTCGCFDAGRVVDGYFYCESCLKDMEADGLNKDSVWYEDSGHMMQVYYEDLFVGNVEPLPNGRVVAVDTLEEFDSIEEFAYYSLIA